MYIQPRTDIESDRGRFSWKAHGRHVNFNILLDWTEPCWLGSAMTRYRVRWLYIHCRGDLVTRLGSRWATAYDCCRPCCWPNRRYFHVSPLAQQLHGWDEQGECGAQLPFSAQDFQKRSTKLDQTLIFHHFWMFFYHFWSTLLEQNTNESWTASAPTAWRCLARRGRSTGGPSHWFESTRSLWGTLPWTNLGAASEKISVIKCYKVKVLYIYFTFLGVWYVSCWAGGPFFLVIMNYCKLLLCIYIYIIYIHMYQSYTSIIYTCIKVIRQLYVYVIMSLYVTMWNIIICSIIMMMMITIIIIYYLYYYYFYSCYMCSVYCHDYFWVCQWLSLSFAPPLFSSWQLERPQESFSGATSRAQALLASLVYMMETAMDLKINILYVHIFIYIALCGFI